MVTERFPIPGILFFTSKNPYSGSYKGLNYRVEPVIVKSEEEGTSHLEVFVWYGMLCSDLAEREAQAKFSLDVDGLAQVRPWLEEQYAEFCRKENK